MNHETDRLRTETLDGNSAVARVAYRTNEVCAIYPITPASLEQSVSPLEGRRLIVW